VTLAEWSGVHTVLTGLWRQHKAPEDDVLKIEHAALPDALTKEQAIGAVRQIWLTGEKWPPSGGEIAALAMKAARPPAPAPGEVIAILHEAIGKFSTHPSLPAETMRANEAKLIRWVADRSPHAARFVVEYGLRQFGREELGDSEYGGAVRQRVERAILGSVNGLEKEYREGRVLPLVGERIKVLEAGGEESSGLRHLGIAGIMPSPPKLGEGDRAA
jgi:hypothetical protein